MRGLIRERDGGTGDGRTAGVSDRTAKAALVKDEGLRED
jgi:hypothetical protein